MKKIFAILLIAAVGTLNAYAEVTVGGAIDMSIIPFQFIVNADTNDEASALIPAAGTPPEQYDYVMGAGAGRYGSGQGPRARLDLRASHEDVIGMRARIQARTDGVAIEDYLVAWWKPTDWLRVDAGRFFDDRLRGKINDLDERNNAANVRMYDGDAIFTRFRTHRYGGQAGLMLSFFFDNVILSNKDNELSFGALLYDLAPFTAASSSLTSAALFDAHPDYVTDNADVYQNIQAAIAWNVKDSFLFRVQYLGAKPQVTITRITDEFIDDNAQNFYTYAFDTFAITGPRIEAAFAFTGVPGLTVDVGGKVSIPFKNWTERPINIFEKEDEELMDPIYKTYKNGFVWQAPYQASLGASYSIGNVEIAGRVDAKFGGSVKGSKNEVHFAPELNAHVWPSYNLGFGRLIFDFGFEYIGAAYDKDGKLIGEGSPRALNGGNRMGMGLSMQKSFGSSLIKGGVTYKFAGTVNGVQEKAVLTVPLYVEYYF